MHVGLAWLAVAVLLAAGEAAGGELFLIMLAGGALGGAAAAALGAPVWGQALAFALVSIILVAGVRPLVRRRLLSALPEHDTNTAALTGRDGTVVEAIGPAGGLVQIAGDTWTARPLIEGETFDAGDKVLVHEIEGATAIVVRGI
ncbi:MAG: NfeD family protein [Dietzia sp.]|uniref:NfeD family protein n=1 Tax=Dietzia TaxID=37914 RepID=UPI0015C9CE1F|nr:MULTISPECIES: NfeD family protein [Dietzia]MBB1034582.1 NfeD family protein [Dietzia sp. CQ4]MBB1039017.1 NfeD family protein [Dietzia natronolimnaea]MBB1039971.1 NfeD family protein [Dietzia sp. Cai40]MBB1043156.1 NfeD family protein [Dietzia sp. DQ11-44]MBB1047452.1 NfeD family protein [Dietzia cercidiphylli]